MSAVMIVLGIETSCDETAAALVDDERRIRASIVASQLEAHGAFGGVVPEIAARAHLDAIEPVAGRCFAEAELGWGDVDAVAATIGPGLIGGVIVGAAFAKAAALARGLPFIGVNHLEGHALTGRLTEGIDFPFLVLLVSGGHSQWLACAGVGRYRLLGTSLDDAAGEAFDKAAKLMDLGFPGGPAIEHWAARGAPDRFALPRPLLGRPGCDFSFSGLKTATRQALAALADPSDQDRADLAASFQRAMVEVISDRAGHAIAAFRALYPEGGTLVVAGGVAANRAIRAALDRVASMHGLRLVAPPLALCTDNAAMIAWAGIERLRLGLVDGLDAPARPRWPLDPSAGTIR